ncbi:MAG: RsbRD N-terminal domain-containing protein, partial [Polyangia bacterium]|nr:RsbRD N-terminal domain-containing protein [Polyangia bacterium]
MKDLQVQASTLAQVRKNGVQPLKRSWIDRLRANPTCLPTELLDELEVRSEAVLEALLEALSSGEPDLSADHFRATVRELSFVGGWHAGRGGSPSMAACYMSGLGEAMRELLGQRGLDWEVWRELELLLTALVMETYCRSLRADGASRLQALLERCTPLVRLPGNEPALLVIGSPSREVLSGLAGKLLVETVRLGARRVIVDLTFAMPLPERALEVLIDLAQHRRLRERALVFTSPPQELRRALVRALGEGHGITLLK